jgi:hypothetical protein
VKAACAVQQADRFLSYLHTEMEVDIMSVYRNDEGDVRNCKDVTGEWRKIA